MAPTSDPQTVSTDPPANKAETRQKLRTVAGASLAGNAIEYFDFSIYGLAAALIFPKLFFPGSDPFISTLLTFATLAVGFIARPLGAIIFGHYGDKIGRKPILVITLLMMGAVTVCIGFMPGYATLGMLAPILLVTLRFIQGIAFGGEWGGAILMAFEYAPEERRGFFAAVPQVGPAAGSILGNAAFLAVTFLPDEHLYSWGWRIPFIFSIVLVFVGLMIRMKIAESPDFQTSKDRGEEVKVPLTEVMKNHMKPVLLVIGGFLGYGTFSIIIMVYLVNHGTNNLGIAPNVMLTATLVAFILQIPTVLFFGNLSDRIDRRKQVAIGTLLAMVAIIGMIAGLQTTNTFIIIGAYAVGFGILYPITYGAQPALFADAFPTPVRFTGMSLGYQVSNVIGSGFAPMIAATLYQITGSIWSVAIFVVLTLVVSLICLVWLVVLANQRKTMEAELAAADALRTAVIANTPVPATVEGR
ncbi:MFS transporter [Corynebacterium sp. A21]|uniref:MFS transporter n=1 Tax=Corynebacterium sp. A21 TaxID=3457318 RepID=UPI003FD669F7